MKFVQLPEQAGRSRNVGVSTLTGGRPRFRTSREDSPSRRFTMIRVIICTLFVLGYAGAVTPILSFYKFTPVVRVVLCVIPPLAVAYLGLVRPTLKPKTAASVQLGGAIALCVLQGLLVFLAEMMNTPPSATGILGLGPFDALEIAVATLSCLLVAYGVLCKR